MASVQLAKNTCERFVGVGLLTEIKFVVWLYAGVIVIKSGTLVMAMATTRNTLKEKRT